MNYEEIGAKAQKGFLEAMQQIEHAGDLPDELREEAVNVIMQWPRDPQAAVRAALDLAATVGAHGAGKLIHEAGAPTIKSRAEIADAAGMEAASMLVQARKEADELFDKITADAEAEAKARVNAADAEAQKVRAAAERSAQETGEAAEAQAEKARGAAEAHIGRLTADAEAHAAGVIAGADEKATQQIEAARDEAQAILGEAEGAGSVAPPAEDDLDGEE